MRIVTLYVVVIASLAAAAVPLGCSSTTSGSAVPDGGAAGTGANPTLDSALSQIVQPVCARLQTCNAAGFAASFPNGINDCVAQSKASAEQQAQSSGRTVTAPANCTDAVLQTCIRDINTQDCSAFTSTTADYALPASCAGKC